MSRFILISPSLEYEHKVRASVAPLSGSLQFFQAAYLPDSPDDILRQQAGDTVGVFISLGDVAASAQGEGGNGTQLTFHKVLVTAVQFSSGQPVQTQGEATQASSQGSLNSDNKDKQSASDSYLITFARNAVDAEKLVYAAEFGKIYLSKEPADATEGTNGVVNQTKVFK